MEYQQLLAAGEEGGRPRHAMAAAVRWFLSFLTFATFFSTLLLGVMLNVSNYHERPIDRVPQAWLWIGGLGFTAIFAVGWWRA